jgi:predicted MPP superfamily phosphohydrolase
MERLARSAESEGLLALSQRIGETHFQQRLRLQSYRAGDFFGYKRALMNPENARLVNSIVSGVLRSCGLYHWGNRNFRNLQIRRQDVLLPRLPAAFEGFTVLHLSDLHLDLDPALVPVIIAHLQQVDYDVCLITGDFRNAHFGDYQPSLDATRLLMPHLKAPAYGILGNHDFIEMVPGLEAMGIRILLNETVQLQQGGETLYLSGIDDPSYYQTDNLEKARQGIPNESTSILLSHSPSAYRKAAAAGFDFMLCGHTHGGQICLPGGVAILRIGNCPGPMLNGAWSYAGMQGYTSPGTGSCGVPVRFFCNPEITLHRLTAAPAYPAKG